MPHSYKNSYKIGYLAQVFPHLTMTFVYREVMALRDLGLDIATFSTWKPKDEELSQEAKPLVQNTTYLLPVSWSRLLGVHLRWLARNPWRYLNTLLFCLFHSATSWRNFVRTAGHFAQAILLAEDATRQKIDHLHVHFALNATTLAMIVARLTNITFSFTAHANDIFANPILLPEKIEAAKFIVAISNYNARFLERIVPGDATHDKIEVVRCGIDVEHFAPDVRQQSFVRDGKKPLIFAVGRLVEKKGFPYLIEACRQLKAQAYDFECSIAGDGPQAGMLAKMIADYGLEDCVRLEGVVFQEQLKDFLARADIVTLPCVVAADGDMDGIPNSLMEGMAMEIPAVSTTISGIPELIEHDHSGLLVLPNDAEALANALATLLTNAELRKRLGMAGRAKVVADYEIHKNTTKLLDLFQARLDSELSPNAREVLHAF